MILRKINEVSLTATDINIGDIIKVGSTANLTIDCINSILKNVVDLEYEIFVVDTDGNIKFQNVIAKKLYPNITNIKKISHIFDFEICILKKIPDAKVRKIRSGFVRIHVRTE